MPTKTRVGKRQAPTDGSAPSNPHEFHIKPPPPACRCGLFHNPMRHVDHSDIYEKSLFRCVYCPRLRCNTPSHCAFQLRGESPQEFEFRRNDDGHTQSRAGRLENWLATGDRSYFDNTPRYRAGQGKKKVKVME